MYTEEDKDFNTLIGLCDCVPCNQIFFFLSPDESWGYIGSLTSAVLLPYVLICVRDSLKIDFIQIWNIYQFGSEKEPYFKLTLRSEIWPLAP